MKYKVGDRVRIRSKEWYKSHKNKFGKIWTDSLSGEGTVCFDHDNAKYCGKEVTIFSIEPENYVLRGIPYEWTDEMIEGLAEELLDNDVKEHQKICDEVLTIQGIEPIEVEMEQIIHCPDGYIFKDENGNVINTAKIVLEKKKKEYPKTYEECAKELGYNQVMPKDHILGYMGTLLSTFQQLLICRDAYWKIAGEEMGLEKPWEPSKDKMVYSIYRHSNEIETDCFSGESVTFEFPTEEMRDAFYENFKELIEICKKLL